MYKNILFLTFIFSIATLTSCREEGTTAEHTTTTTTDTSPQDQAPQMKPDIVNNPATASTENQADNQNLPEFAFEKESHNFGKITQGEMLKYSFKFTNTGKSDLVINNASGSCGCTVPNWPKQPIPAGGTGNIDIEYNSAGKTGMQNVSVTIVANTIPNTKVLTVTGEVFPANQ